MLQLVDAFFSGILRRPFPLVLSKHPLGKVPAPTNTHASIHVCFSHTTLPNATGMSSPLASLFGPLAMR